MQLPDFSEFLASVDVDEMAREYNKLNELRIIQFRPDDPKAVSAAIQMLYQKAMENSAQITMMTLQAYHDWLQKELG